MNGWQADYKNMNQNKCLRKSPTGAIDLESGLAVNGSGFAFFRL
jgi:hypothetical protein